MIAPDLQAAAAAIDTARGVLAAATARLAELGDLDENQVLAYELAHSTAAVEMSATLLDYGAKGDTEARIACAFAADSVSALAGKVFGHETEWAVEPGALDAAREFVGTYSSPEFLLSIDGAGPRHLDDDFEMVQDTFRRFAEEQIVPHAEHVHRTNGDVPEEVIAGLAELGAFGLSIPEEFGGFAAGGESDYIGMVVATEEL